MIRIEFLNVIFKAIPGLGAPLEPGELGGRILARLRISFKIGSNRLKIG